MTNTPNQDLPDDPLEEDLDELDEDLEVNNDLPDERQPPRGKGNNRGKSENAPGKNKPQPEG